MTDEFLLVHCTIEYYSMIVQSRYSIYVYYILTEAMHGALHAEAKDYIMMSWMKIVHPSQRFLPLSLKQ